MLNSRLLHHLLSINMKFIKQSLIAVATLGFLTACQAPPMQMGDPAAKTVATGSAAGSTTAGSNTALERCAAPLGTISLIENVNAGRSPF